LSFDKALSALTPEAFARDVLRRGVGVAHVAVGADFRFGAGRAGDVRTLEALGRDLGFTVEALDHVGDEQASGSTDGATAFSSSAARAALREGRPADAARILGDWHRIEGVVEKGDQRGRELGYPTANLSLGPVLRPAFGVYAVRAEVCDGPHAGVYDGVASLGVRPMFELPAPNLETFLFDFQGDLYGARLSVGLVAYLRPEARFDGLEALIAQMDADSLAARAALAAIDPPPWA
ncbi:MAG: riboflavin kinase, partial [Pseudomonadota bacterium]